MPSYGIHLIVLDRVADELKTAGYTREAALLTHYSDYASLGAMGPDIYFFAPDINQEVADLIDFLFQVYEVLEPFIDVYEDYIAPIMDAANAGVDWLTGGLWNSLGDTMNRLNGMITVLMTKLVVDQIDFFKYFEPNLNKGNPEKDWYWIEMGHGRRTGQFGWNLQALAGGDDALRAYTCGYLTHIITDVVGHPFVNQIVGGPFRTHWHRHHMVENFMDVWAWNHYKNQNILESSLDNRIAFGGGDLSGDLLGLIDGAFRNTFPYPTNAGEQFHFPNRLNAGYLSQEQINQTFVLFRKYLKMATSRGIMSLPTPQPPQVIPGLGGLFSNPPSSSGGGFSWSALWDWIKWLFEQAFKILTLPEHILASLTTYQLRYLLYQLQMALYSAYQSLRETLVLGGYVMCEPSYLTSPYGLEFTRQRLPAPAQRMHNLQYPFPHLEYPTTATFMHQLPYPPTGEEQDGTESSPYPVGATPDCFIDQSPFNAAAGPLAFAPTPEHTQSLDYNTLPSGAGQLGNAVDWCVKLILKAQHNTLRLNPDLPDWNLDADRGYGWLNWYWHPYDQNPNPHDLTRVNYSP